MLPENEHPESEPELTPEEELRAQNEIAAALFDAEHGSFTHIAKDLPADVFQQFLANVKAFEEGAASMISVREVLGSNAKWADGTKIQTAEEGEQAIADLEALLKKHHLHVERPAHLSPAGYYYYLTVDLMDHLVVPPTAELHHVIDYDDVRQDSPNYMADVSEQFLAMLFDLERPFDPSIFAKEVRLNGVLTTPERALQSINGWRGQFQSLTPGECRPGEPIAAPDGATYFTFDVAYTTVDVDGNPETQEGPSLVQLSMDPKERFWRVCGATMPGFEL